MDCVWIFPLLILEVSIWFIVSISSKAKSEFLSQHQNPNLPFVTSGILEPKSEKYLRGKKMMLYLELCRNIRSKLLAGGGHFVNILGRLGIMWVTIGWKQCLDFTVWFSLGYKFSFQLVKEELSLSQGQNISPCYSIMLLLKFFWKNK